MDGRPVRRLRLLLGSGHDLAGIADGSVDPTVLVDTAPSASSSSPRSK
ncbi:MAG: hypothetical protein ACRETZ_14650 [Steroidobacteraceae bacterium]